MAIDKGEENRKKEKRDRELKLEKSKEYTAI